MRNPIDCMVDAASSLKHQADCFLVARDVWMALRSVNASGYRDERGRTIVMLDFRGLPIAFMDIDVVLGDRMRLGRVEVVMRREPAEAEIVVVCE